jgi:hypothetical protein
MGAGYFTENSTLFYHAARCGQEMAHKSSSWQGEDIVKHYFEIIKPKKQEMYTQH